MPSMIGKWITEAGYKAEVLAVGSASSGDREPDMTILLGTVKLPTVGKEKLIVPTYWAGDGDSVIPEFKLKIRKG